VPAPELALLEPAGDEPKRIVMLVPGAQIGRHRERLAHRRLFEKGREDADRPFGRDDGAGQAFAPAPPHSGEVDEARAGLDEDGGDALLLHQPLRLRDPRFPFGAADRDDGAGHRRQLGLGSQRECGQGKRGGDRSASGHRHEAAPIDGDHIILLMPGSFPTPP
jgi:hypothetical protein